MVLATVARHEGAAGMRAEVVRDLAWKCGFELAGVAAAVPLPEAGYYRHWVSLGMAGEMTYLAGRRAEIRRDPALLLPGVRSVICAGKLYNGPQPRSTEFDADGLAWISRYAWGDDYHDVLRRGLLELAGRLAAESRLPFDWKICVDTAPLAERAYARRAGLGWIGKNSCLINQAMGSWFFLGELLVTLAIEPDTPPPDRCGSCTRCIDACPTGAIVPANYPGGPSFTVDSRLCISYLTIELRGPVPDELRSRMGKHVFGCDICQDVCPWNRRAPATAAAAFAPRCFAPPLDKLSSLSEAQFREMFHGGPVTRARYAGFLRNVAIAMGNAGSGKYRRPLERLAASPDRLVAAHARWALAQLK